ncbi:MAG: hypothetical protein QXT86_10760 [Archaeoglobaceae archaeon]
MLIFWQEEDLDANMLYFYLNFSTLLLNAGLLLSNTLIHTNPMFIKALTLQAYPIFKERL